MEYVINEFNGSYAYNTVMSATKDQLLNRLPYIEGAIEYHKKNNNQGQVKFFTDQLKLVKKRLQKLK